MAQIVPFAGAVVGASFDAHYTSNVCDTAFYLYRGKFLAEKYGENIIDVTVEPADGFKPELDD